MLKRLIVCCFLLSFAGVVCSRAVSQCGSINRDSLDSVRQEVGRIFNNSLDNMEFVTPTGVKTATWVPPTEADVEQVKCLGSPAVPFIAEHLNSRRSFGTLLAVRMLGWIGGKDIVPVLARVLRSSNSQTVKISALESLYSASVPDSLPIIKAISKSDTNPNVREKASQILARYDLK
jgi:hypothetical protein